MAMPRASAAGLTVALVGVTAAWSEMVLASRYRERHPAVACSVWQHLKRVGENLLPPQAARALACGCPSTGFSGYRKSHGFVILSEAKNLSSHWTYTQERFFASLRMTQETFSAACLVGAFPCGLFRRCVSLPPPFCARSQDHEKNPRAESLPYWLFSMMIFIR
jgi:hypothetical protein